MPPQYVDLVRGKEAGRTLLKGKDNLARPLHEIARLDRRWFRAHPERRHRCRWPDTGELGFATTAAARSWSWRSATSGAATSSISQWSFRACSQRMKDRLRFCLLSQRPPRADPYGPSNGRAPARDQQAHAHEISRRCSGCKRPGSVPTIAAPASDESRRRFRRRGQACPALRSVQGSRDAPP